MYDATPDPYCYRGTTVLKNKADLRSQEALDEFETAMTFARAVEPLPSGRFSITHYKAVHFHLFQDVYHWAGRIRTVRLTKGNSTFCYPENIRQEMRRIFEWIKETHCFVDWPAQEFFAGAAYFLSELNAIHPFREGNGRTQLIFFALLAENANHPIDLDKLEAQSMLDAMIKSFNGDEAPLAALLATLSAD